MEDEKVIEKIIDKALANGWNPLVSESRSGTETKLLSYKEDKIHVRSLMIGTALHNIKDICFDHDFAKAFWKDGNKVAPIPIVIKGKGKGMSYTYDTALIPKSLTIKHILHAFKNDGILLYDGSTESWRYNLQTLVLCEDLVEYLIKFL